MIEKICVCGKRIPDRASLCKDCLSLYGSDRSFWPAWVIDWIQKFDHERYYENYHRDLPIEFIECAWYQNDNSDVSKRNRFLAQFRSRIRDIEENAKQKHNAAKTPPAQPPFIDDRNRIELKLGLYFGLPKLTQIERRVLMYFLYGYTQEETALILDISRSLVSVIRRMAVAKMVQQLT